MPDKPTCPDCDSQLECSTCDDPRPRADAVAVGWELFTPFGRWEKVVDAGRQDDFGPMCIWTERSAGHPWRYHASTKVDAVRPRHARHGSPIIRVSETPDRTGPIWASACLDTDDHVMPSGPGLIAAASRSPDGPGWTVLVQLGNDRNRTTEETKSKARTAVRAAARRAAKRLNVKLILTPESETR